MYANALRLDAQPKLLFDLADNLIVDVTNDGKFRRPVYVGVKNISSATIENVEVTLIDFETLPYNKGLKEHIVKPLKPRNINGDTSGNKVTLYSGQTKYFQIGEEGLNDIITLQTSGSNITPVTAKFYLGYAIKDPKPVDPSRGIAYDPSRSKAITFKPVEGFESKVWIAPSSREEK